MTGNLIVVYTDGGCRGNPGPGGWAYVMRYGDRYREAMGAEPTTTNNRMELTAVIEALSFLKSRLTTVQMAAQKNTISLPFWSQAPICIYTDSQYVRNGMTGWVERWKINGWKTAGKKPVQNRDLWERLDQLVSELHPSFEWIEGHSGNQDNERCDTLVHMAIDQMLAEREELQE
ncbi:MAG: ribonuclease HI [Rectinema sp.]|nr:ribonuclease HI [Rectinema sp.]